MCEHSRIIMPVSPCLDAQRFVVRRVGTVCREWGHAAAAAGRCSGLAIEGALAQVANDTHSIA